MVWVLRTAKQRARGDWVQDHHEVASGPPIKGSKGVTPENFLNLLSTKVRPFMVPRASKCWTRHGSVLSCSRSCHIQCKLRPRPT